MPQDFERGFERDDHRHGPRWSGINQSPFEGYDFQDSSEPLFSMYLKIGDEEDKKMVERWQKDAKEILLFTGLFSAAFATLLTVTVLDLKSNPQDTLTFYLGNMYLIPADPNIPRAFIPPKPPPFSPPTSAIWANALLFMSLLITLACALLATLLQQWARRYVGITQQLEYSPHRRARVRAFFFEGVEKSHISWVAEALPALLHLSICFFFAGLLVWLFNINHLVFLSVILCAALSAVAYLWFTFSPIFRPNSPYYVPLSLTIWTIYTSISYTTFNGIRKPLTILT